MEEQPVKPPAKEWDIRCPHCGAELQEVARRCWNCGADIPAQGFDDSEYRASTVEPEAVEGISISLVVALAFMIPLILLAWAAYAVLSPVLQLLF
ncbi:MAG: zinc ribbon domain-containing protein [Pirellulales bacterium]|nr:zinc ribbon domain-containing protein [Pirellulales bacterium]